MILNQGEQNNNTIKYDIYAQNSNGDLIVRNLEKNNYFIRAAQEIMNDAQLLQGFPPKQIEFIKVLGNFLLRTPF